MKNILKNILLKLHFHIWDTHCGISRVCKICDKRQIRLIDSEKDMFIKYKWFDESSEPRTLFFNHENK